MNKHETSTPTKPVPDVSITAAENARMTEALQKIAKTNLNSISDRDFRRRAQLIAANALAKK